MSLGNRSGRNWFGASVLIAVGVIGLIANFNLVPRAYLDQAWKLWPLVPLGIGLAILLRRQGGNAGPS